MCLIGGSRYGIALPVEGSVPQIWDLRWKGRVNVQGEIREESKTEIAEEDDLVGTAVASQEGVSRMGTAVCSEIVD